MMYATPDQLVNSSFFIPTMNSDGSLSVGEWIGVKVDDSGNLEARELDLDESEVSDAVELFKPQHLAQNCFSARIDCENFIKVEMIKKNA